MEDHPEAVAMQADTTFEDEIAAMKTISQVFTRLDTDARQRVLAWTSSRFGIRILADLPRDRPATRSGQQSTSPEAEVSAASSDPTSFQYPAELFDAARPRTDMDKALVLGYWFQVCKATASFTSRQVNDELKHIGHGVSNITRALDALSDTKPALVIQLEKSGKTKQAQKKFKVTHEGVKHVQQMLAGTGGE
jgi:hypothetical protein